MNRKPAKSTKGNGLRFAKYLLRLCIYIYYLILLPEPATGGVLAACGLREHCALLFKPLLHFRMSVYVLAYVFTGGKGFLNDCLKFVVRPEDFWYPDGP